jgi:hypothetical protein
MDYRPLFTQFSDLLSYAKTSSVITKDHLETTNRTALNETHSIVLTFLLEAALRCRGTEFGVVTVERSLKPKDKPLFRPDITLWNIDRAKRILAGVLEYESPNSGDERIWDKNIEYFHNFIQYPQSPLDISNGWIIMTTLPDHEVSGSDWKNWYYNKSDPEYAEMIVNPREFWYRKYEAEFNRHKSCCFGKCSLSLTNLTYDRLQIHLTSDPKLIGTVWQF